jgi:hypothetical protein
MPRWFLSYHSPEQALAERVKAAIERKDPASRVFFAPLHNRAGGFWTAQLAQEIADATAFILLVGARGLGPWQVLEYDEALDKRVKSPDFPLVMMLLDGQTAPGLPFLRRLHWIVTPEPDSEKDIARLFDAASGSGTRPGELWRHASPYRGLAAMQEKDSDYFFGRARETVDVLSGFAAAPDRLPLLIGNSGVGKSSLAQAGVLAALKRQAWPEGSGETETWPHGFAGSRRWCFLTVRPGVNPLQALVEPFLQIWQFDPTDPRREMRRTEWIENLREGRNTLSGLLTATEARLEEQGQPSPPGFFLYVDQGEELYTRAGRSARLRFSEIVAQGLNDPRLRAMMSLRADFFGDFQKDVPLCAVHRQINVLPAAGDATARRGQPAGGAALGTVRDRFPCRRHRQARRGRIDRGCRRVAAAFLSSRRHLAAHGRAWRWCAALAGAVNRSWQGAGGACRCVHAPASRFRRRSSSHFHLEARHRARGRRTNAAPGITFRVLRQ